MGKNLAGAFAAAILVAGAGRVSAQCHEVHMDGFTIVDCGPPKAAPSTSRAPDPTYMPSPGGYRPEPSDSAGPTGFGESMPGDAEKYKKFKEKNPNFGEARKTATPVVASAPPPRHEGEYRVALRGGTVYWSKEKPALKNRVYSFRSSGVLMALKMADVETIAEPLPPAAAATPPAPNPKK
jgi:hypothetical protein